MLALCSVPPKSVPWSKTMKVVLLYSGHAIAEMSHDKNGMHRYVRGSTQSVINGVANIHIDNYTDWVQNGCGLGVA